MKRNFFSRDGKLLTEGQSKYYYYRKTFLYSALIACLITIPFVLWEWIRTGHGIFLYYGDYNAQQIAFYKHCVGMVQEGNFGWDWFTDIGSNFVGSYSYYMLGSPFFWIMCLFPASWAPYLMGPMYIIKYIVAAMLAYVYLQRWVKNKDYAVLGALLYAFCGFQIYNTFFNQFHEVVALFPLLLIGMEEYIQNNRKGLFAIAVCLNAMVNYFMFAGQVAFCVLYFLFRFSDRSFRVTIWKFLGLALEAVLGLAMSMVLFLPGAMALLGNDRTARSFGELKHMLIWWKDSELYWQRYGQILESYFFPPDIPSRVNFFYGHTERWASISAYLPLFGMTGVFAFFTTKRRTWLKALIIFLVVCSFVPILNSLFFLGNSSYYARWMYLMVLMMVLATIIALDRGESRWKAALAASMGAILAIAVPLGLLWYDEPSSDAVDIQLGRAPFPLRFWIYTAIAIAGIAILWYLIKHYRGTKVFAKGLLAATAGCIVLYSCVHIINGKEHSYTSDFMVHQVINGEDVILPDAEEQFYRIDFYRATNISTIDNLNIYWHYPSIECFHTVVPPSLMNFYDLLDYNRSVGSRAMSSWYGLRALTSTEYSFIESSRNGREEVSLQETLANLVEIAEYDGDSDWTLMGSEDSVRVYRSSEGETAEVLLYDLTEYLRYEGKNGWKEKTLSQGQRLFEVTVLNAGGVRNKEYHIVDESNQEELDRYIKDPGAEEIQLSELVRLYGKSKSVYNKIVFASVLLSEISELQELENAENWERLAYSAEYRLFKAGDEYRLVPVENGSELNAMQKDPAWSEVDLMDDNCFVYVQEDAQGNCSYREIHLENTMVLDPYEGSAAWTRVEQDESYYIFASVAEQDVYQLVDKSNAEQVQWFRENADWKEVPVTADTRVYYSSQQLETPVSTEEMALISLKNSQLDRYENDSDWELVEERIGYRKYIKQKFNVEKGWVYYDTQNGFDIYRNENYLPMGFSFDGFMKESEFEKITSGFHRSILLCNYLVVPDEKAAYYAQFMTEYVKDSSAPGNQGKPVCKAANYANFAKAVAERKTMTCTDFTWDSDGFSAKYSSDETDIVFFSVPAEGAWYDASQSAESEEDIGFLDKIMNSLGGTGGWSATVNGKEVEILTVYKGFMAVEVPAGEDVEIVFTYETFGGKLGLWISLGGLFLFLVYLGVLIWRKKFKADYRLLDGSYYEAGDVDTPAKKAVVTAPAEETSAETDLFVEDDLPEEPQ